MNKTDIWNMTLPEWLDYMVKEGNWKLATGRGDVVFNRYKRRVEIFEEHMKRSMPPPLVPGPDTVLDVQTGNIRKMTKAEIAERDRYGLFGMR